MVIPGQHRDRLLLSVTKPTRYLGNELNSVRKDPGSVKVRFALAFPDVYEVAMSHLGTHILYGVLNSRDDVAAERVFAPWVDMEERMRSQSLPLFGLETWDSVSKFDIIGFSLQYEMGYSNVLNMMDLAGIPLWSSQRDESHPLILGGGPCVYSGEPIAPFFDAMVLGEGERVLNEVVDGYISWKYSGRPRGKRGLLEGLAEIPGVYIPSLYRVTYTDKGMVKAIVPCQGAPRSIMKRVVDDLDLAEFPLKPIVPNMDVVHDRLVLEVFRGCTRGCRFCSAGYVYRPVRERSPGLLLEQARKCFASTGHDEISLSSLSTTDYSAIGGIVKVLGCEFEPKGVGISLPSLRADSFSLDLARQVQRVRKSGLTLAPEAGSQRLRDTINKDITEEGFLEAVGQAFKSGWDTLKLYFMIGLPGEEDTDLDAIGDLVGGVRQVYRDIAGKRRLRVTVSASVFVPKSHTPFQWEPQPELGEIVRRQQYLAQKLRMPGVRFSWHDPEVSFVEAVLSRGDRRLAFALEGAWRKGARFDAWTEHFRLGRYLEALKEEGLDPGFYANRRRSHDEVFPWDHLSVGLERSFLEEEHRKALRGEKTPDCRTDPCTGCGVCFQLGIPVDLKEEAPLQEKRAKAPSVSSDGLIRARLAKKGDARFMSHLDMRRALERAIRRAEIPVAKTRGFNPHLKFALAAALPVGAGSQAEYADFFLEEPMDVLEFARRLSGSLPPGVELMKVRAVPPGGLSLEASVRAARYRVRVECDGSVRAEEVEAVIGEILSLKEMAIERRGKKHHQDVRPLIHALNILGLSGGNLEIGMVLGAGPKGSLRPEEVVEILGSKLGGRIRTDFATVEREDLLIDESGSWQTP